MSLTFDRWPLTRRSTGWGIGRPVRRGWEFKTPPYTLHFSHFLLQSLPSLHIIASRRFFDQISDRLQVEDLIFGRICARVLVWNPGFHLLRASPLCTARLKAAQLHLRASRVSGWWLLLLPCFPSLFGLLLPLLFHWMAPRRETGTSKAQGKRPVEPSQPKQMEARRKARFDTALFSSNEDYQR